MAGADTPQVLTLFEAIVPIASLIVLVALSYAPSQKRGTETRTPLGSGG